jgi:hypothetical protein
MSPLSIHLTVSIRACPLEIFGTIGDRPVWYRQRGAHWTLHEATPAALETAYLTKTAQIDTWGRVVAPGVQCLADGSTQSGEEEADLWAAVARIVAYGARGDLAEGTRDGLERDGWLIDPELLDQLTEDVVDPGARHRRTESPGSPVDGSPAVSPEPPAPLGSADTFEAPADAPVTGDLP